jgi:enoyl-CoA hydratase/carnithine racemase
MVALALTTEQMIAEIDGAIGWVIFSNPARRNAVSMEMWQAIPAIFDSLEAEPAVRAIVLRGAGDKAFVSGLDISQFEDAFHSSQAAERLEALSAAANRRIRQCPKPTVAMIHGFCIGAGMQIAANCDLRIAADTASFAVTAAKLGLGYPVASVARLTEVLGPTHAAELFFTARLFSAAEAERIGFLNRVLTAAELDAGVRETCQAIAANAPLTVSAFKQVMVRLAQAASEQDLAACEEAMKACFDSADYAEGRRAFREKRKPVFTGR